MPLLLCSKFHFLRYTRFVSDTFKFDKSRSEMYPGNYCRIGSAKFYQNLIHIAIHKLKKRDCTVNNITPIII